MKEFVEENHTKSYDSDLREAYNKEEALKEQYYADGQKEGLEQGKKEGIEQGKKVGIEQGKINEKKEIACKMLKAGMDVSLISKITSLTEEKIKNLNQT